MSETEESFSWNEFPQFFSSDLLNCEALYTHDVFHDLSDFS